MKTISADHAANNNPQTSVPSSSAKRPGPSNAIVLTILAMLVATAVTFTHWPVLSAQAQSFDDHAAIAENYLVQDPSWNSVWRFFSEVTLSSVVQGYYRPLTLTSLMLDWAMGGRPDDLTAFHRTSLALHVGSTVLLVLLCYQVFKQPIVAAMVGLLFGLHPLTVEPIAWVMERKTILAAIFTFACLCAYVHYAQTAGRKWYAAAVVLYLLSLLAKPTGTPLPFMLLLMDYWPLNRFNRRAIVEKAPFFILAAVFALLCVVCEQKVNPLSLPAKLSPLHLPLRLCWLIVFYPYKILLPINLSSIYLLPKPLGLTNELVLLAVAGVIVMVAALYISRRWTPAFWVGTAIFYVGLAPTMGFIGYSWVSASDKYAYLPAFGLLLLLGWLLERAWSAGNGNRRKIQRVMVTAIVLLLACLMFVGTRYQTRNWRTTIGYCTYCVNLTPEAPYPYNNRGLAYGQIADFANAIKDFTKAIELNDTESPELYGNRGNAYYFNRDYENAIRDCIKAIELDPNYAMPYQTRGGAYSSLGDLDRAIKDLNIAIELKPDDVQAYYKRGIAFGKAGKYELAIQDFTKTIRHSPKHLQAYYNRGIAYDATGEHARAIQDYTRAIELKPEYALAYNNRGNSYSKLHDFARGIQDYCKAIDIKPDLVTAYSNRCKAYFNLKQYDKAWADVAKCQQLGYPVDAGFIKVLTQASSRPD